MVSIQIDAKQFADAQRLLQKFPKEVKLAAAAAINRTITTVRKEVSKAVTKNYTIKSGVVKQTLDTKRSSGQRLSGEISSKGSPMSLKRFRVSRNAMGTNFSKINSAVDTTGGARKRKRSPIKVQILKRRRLAPLSAGALFKTPKGQKMGCYEECATRTSRYPLPPGRLYRRCLVRNGHLNNWNRLRRKR